MRLLVVDHLTVARCPGSGGRRRCGLDGPELQRASVAENLADFAGADRQNLSVEALDLCRTGPHAEARRVLRGARLDIIVALLLQGDRAARRHDLIGLRRIHRKGLHVDAALCQLQADLFVIDLRHVEFGGPVHADAGTGDGNLAAGVGLGPDRVAAREWRVEDGLRPAALLIVVKRHRTVHECQPSDPSRRFALGLSRGGQGNQ